MTLEDMDVRNDALKELNQEYIDERTQAFLVVGFDDHMEVISRTDAERDQEPKLSEMMNRGGVPTGLIKVTRANGVLSFFTKNLPAFAEDETVNKCLTELTTTLCKQLVLGDTGT